MTMFNTAAQWFRSVFSSLTKLPVIEKIASPAEELTPHVFNLSCSVKSFDDEGLSELLPRPYVLNLNHGDPSFLVFKSGISSNHKKSFTQEDKLAVDEWARDSISHLKTAISTFVTITGNLDISPKIFPFAEEQILKIPDGDFPNGNPSKELGLVDFSFVLFYDHTENTWQAIVSKKVSQTEEYSSPRLFDTIAAFPSTSAKSYMPSMENECGYVYTPRHNTPEFVNSYAKKFVSKVKKSGMTAYIRFEGTEIKKFFEHLASEKLTTYAPLLYWDKILFETGIKACNAAIHDTILENMPTDEASRPLIDASPIVSDDWVNAITSFRALNDESQLHEFVVVIRLTVSDTKKESDFGKESSCSMTISHNESSESLTLINKALVRKENLNEQ